MNPPRPENVAYRALCLGALQWRTDFEVVTRTVGNAQVARMHQDMTADLEQWLEREGIAAHCSAREESLLQKPLGTWSEEELHEASWQRECSGVIVWALSHLDAIPPYDTTFADPEAVTGLPILRPLNNFVDRVTLRPMEEIARERATAQLWHWRAQTRQKREEGAQPPKGWTFDRMIHVTAKAAHEQGRIPEPIEGDFPAFGKPYGQLSDNEHSQVRSIATERHLVLNWLCGYADDWDAIPTDV